MPKTFPDAPAKEQPSAGNSSDPTASLADLLFSGAGKDDVAQHLRDVRDEWSSHLIAEWLTLAVAAIPVLLRAVADGQDASRRRIETDELYRRLRVRGPDASTPAATKSYRSAIAELRAESRTLSRLGSGHDTATQGLLAIRHAAPALLDDPRAKPSDKETTLEAVHELRMQLSNYFIDNKLEVEVDADGWPRSVTRRDNEPRRSVRLVTVQQPGMRGSK